MPRIRYMKDGWWKYNPNSVPCAECDSMNVEWFWSDGEVNGFQCLDCGETLLDK